MDFIIPGYFIDGLLWYFIILAGLTVILIAVGLVMLLFAKPINQTIRRIAP